MNYLNTLDNAVLEILDKGPGKASADDLKLAQMFTVEKQELEEGQDPNTDRAMITTQSVDRDGDIIVANGVQLANFRKNPVVLFGHNSWDAKNIMGRSITEQIIPGQGIMASWAWADQANAEAAMVKALWRGNFLNAISVGFIPFDWKRRKDPANGTDLDGWEFTAWEMLEYSVVPIPANQDALRLSLALASGKMESIPQEKLQNLINIARQGSRNLDPQILINQLDDIDHTTDGEPTNNEHAEQTGPDQEMWTALSELLAAFKQSKLKKQE